MKRTLAFIAGMAWTFLVQGAEQSCVPVPKGWEAETKAVAGGLCADVLFAADEEGTRKLRVYEAGKPAFETDEAALCKTCGGMLGDPFQDIAWIGQTLAVTNAGGSRESWGETWKFAKRKGRWLIAGWDRENLDRMTMDTWTDSVNTLAGKATAEFSPGEESKRKPKRLSCRHEGRVPAATEIGAVRDREPFACGMKVELAD